jgi:hypothetical protein
MKEKKMYEEGAYKRFKLNTVEIKLNNNYKE